MVHREGDQLEMFHPAEMRGVHYDLWRGQSPRALTRGHWMFTLTAQAGGLHERCDSPREARCMDAKGPPVFYRGAPLLLPLKPEA